MASPPMDDSAARFIGEPGPAKPWEQPAKIESENNPVPLWKEPAECAAAEPEPCPEPMEDEDYPHDVGKVEAMAATRPSAGSLPVAWAVCPALFCILCAFAHSALQPRTIPQRPHSELPDWQAADSNVGSKAITIPLNRHSAEMRTASGKIHYKSAYWGMVSVGYPAVPFKVVFDTGSGHVIVPSTYCQTETCRAHRRYRRSASSSGIDIDGDGKKVEPGEARDQITVSFGTGEVHGVFVEETVCLGESIAKKDAAKVEALGLPPPGSVALGKTKLPTPPRVLAKECMRLRTIVAIEMSKEPFRTFPFDGVLGLGLTSLSQAPEFNFVDNIATSVLGGERMFAMFLSGSDEEQSEITLGGWNPKRLAGPISWTPAMEENHGHWMLKVKAIRVDGEEIDYCEDGCKAVVDSGTSLISVPPPVFPELLQRMEHSTTIGHCQSGGPVFDIELQDFTVSLSAKEYARFENTSWGGDGVDRCKPMMMSLPIAAPLGPKLFLLGETVLRKYYTVFDARQKRIGFALSRRT